MDRKELIMKQIIIKIDKNTETGSQTIIVNAIKDDDTKIVKVISQKSNDRKRL